MLVKFQNVSLIDYFHKKFLLVFEYIYKQLYFALIAYIKQLISPISLPSTSPNSYLVSRPESFHRSNNLYSARLNAVTPSETRRLCAPRSTASRQPTPSWWNEVREKPDAAAYFRNFLARWSGTRPSLSRSSRDRRRGLKGHVRG